MNPLSEAIEWRLSNVEHQLEKLDVEKASVQEMHGLREDIKGLREDIKSHGDEMAGVKRWLMTLAVSIAGSSVVFALTQVGAH